MMLRLFSLSLLIALLAGCASQTPAPVAERAPVAPAAAEIPPGFYAVKKGDTLYRIALDHGVDYKELLAWNRVDNPNRIEVGQQLRIAPPEGTPVAVSKPVTGAAPVEVKPVGVAPVPTSLNTAMLKQEPRGGKLPWSEENLAKLREAETGVAAKPAPAPTAPAASPVATTAEDGIDWSWPAPGKLLAGFSETGDAINKGLDIAARTGEPVQAAAAGKVVYVGNGLRGYGNLVIVRHTASFLSAYAHNSKILVKEGQAVAKGQKIAEAGSSDSDQTKLHFEIRRQGKPVDPAKYLPPR